MYPQLLPHTRYLNKLYTRYNALSTKSQIVVVILLTCLLFPSFTTLVEGIDGYILYLQARNGIQHLLNVQHIFSGQHDNRANYFTSDTLHHAQNELYAAEDSFLLLTTRIEQSPSISGISLLLPQQISSLHALSHLGLDVAILGQQMTQAALATPDLHQPHAANSTQPLLTPAIMHQAESSLLRMQPLLRDMATQIQAISLDSLPISAHQRQQARIVLQSIATLLPLLEQPHAFIVALSWFLGVDAPRTFLVQTMDRAELRPTGGFTGQFAELKFTGGQLAPFTLQDISPFEKGPTILPAVLHQRPPAPYNSWWPIDNWGLRDANLSADFPSSAGLASDLYQSEFHRHVDGVLAFSLFLVTHVLQITGPITVPLYNVTVTAQNLEDTLHFYQEQHGDAGGIRREKELEHVSDDNVARKLFTKRLTNLLMQHLRQAPPTELLALANELLYALKSKDLAVYFTNSQLEELVSQYGSTGQIATSTSHDGLMVVQTNVSANKASKYVQTTLSDMVTLDPAGGATHVMQMRLVYTQIGNPFGFDTYSDYVRVYVPASAHFRWGNGFDLGPAHPLCGYTYGHCHDDIYHDGTLLCPPGLTDAGYGQQRLNDPQFLHNHSINQVGAPPNRTNTDQPGRAMYGGWVTLPKNCNLTVSLSWYVPVSGQQPYSLFVQRQASTQPLLDLTILPTPATCRSLHTMGIHFNGVLTGTDRLFSLPATQVAPGVNCYPISKV